MTVEPSNALPEDANPITDASGLAFVDVTVPPGLTDSEATMQLTLDANALGDVDPADLAIYHYEDGEWTALDTTVVSTAAGEVVLEATTPGFSLFAVGTVPQQTTPAVTTPDAPDDDPPDGFNPDDGTATPSPDGGDGTPDSVTVTPGTNESDNKPGSPSGVTLFVLLVGAVVVVALAVVAVRHRS